MSTPKYSTELFYGSWFIFRGDDPEPISVCTKEENAQEIVDGFNEKQGACRHAKLKHAVYKCSIGSEIAIDMLDCNGRGTYSAPGNNGFGYSYPCNNFIVEGK